jgi:hypothetical protein
VENATMTRLAARSNARPRRFGRLFLIGLTALGAALLLPLAAAHAADGSAAAGLAKFVGQYKYAGTRDEGIAIVEKAMDEALADVNIVMRTIAKKAMAQNFAETVAIDGDAGKLGIKIGENNKVAAGIGKTETVTGKDGKSGKATHAFDGTKLTETITGDDGSIVNVFTLSADGKTLTRDTTVTSQRMKKPLKYRLLYTRK